MTVRCVRLNSRRQFPVDPPTLDNERMTVNPRGMSPEATACIEWQVSCCRLASKQANKGSSRNITCYCLSNAHTQRPVPPAKCNTKVFFCKRFSRCDRSKSKSTYLPNESSGFRGHPRFYRHSFIIERGRIDMDGCRLLWSQNNERSKQSLW